MSTRRSCAASLRLFIICKSLIAIKKIVPAVQRCSDAFAMPLWLIWGIAAAATAGVIIRPFFWPEFIWAVTGAALLILFGLLSLRCADRRR